MFCSSHWRRCRSSHCVVFPCVQSTGNIPSCSTGHFGKLCCSYNSSEVFSWWCRTGSEHQCLAHRVFVTSEHDCNTNTVFPPSQGMPLKSSILLKKVFDAKPKNVKYRWPEAPSHFLLSVLQEGQTTFLSLVVFFFCNTSE